MRIKFTAFLIFIATASFCQTKSVLFLGNSYTYVNNLPQLTATLAASVGDSLVYDSNTPGGYTLEGHSTNATSLNKIMQGNWDFVVLQEQSQRPSFPLGQVQNDVFPYATFLDSVINANNMCAETMFYMTWGRKNGDASNCAAWPPVCTYQGMDSLLNLRYRMMADDNDAVVSPVGEVWKYIRNNFPTIELYSTDESHPSVAGSYAAACCFYSAIFRKDPTLITNDHALSAMDAANIRTAAKIIVFDSLINWNIGEYDLISSFNYTQVSGFTYQFTNTSQNAIGQNWNINGVQDTSTNPSFTFAGTGNYHVELISYSSCDTVEFADTLSILPSSISEYSENNDLNIYPNPAKNQIALNLKSLKGYSLILFNNSGEKVLEIPQLISNTINIESLINGIYLLELSNFESVSSIKFIKE